MGCCGGVPQGVDDKAFDKISPNQVPIGKLTSKYQIEQRDTIKFDGPPNEEFDWRKLPLDMEVFIKNVHPYILMKFKSKE